MAGLVPAVRYRCRVSEEAGPGGQRRKLNVRIGARYAESQVEGSRARVKHQGGVQQVGFVEDVPRLDYIQESHEQQEEDAESHHDDQGHSSRGMLFYFYA